MGAYVVRRILIAIPAFIGITIVAFAILASAPGDPVAALIAPEQRATMTTQQLEALRRDYGFDGPPWVRYIRWVGLEPFIAPFTGDKAVPGILQGNFGYAISGRRPVMDEIAARIPPTVLLMGASLLLSILVGIPVGLISAVWQYGKLDYLLTTITMLMISTPIFLFGLILIYLLGVTWNIFPIGGMQTLGEPFSLTDLASHMAMPVMAIGLSNAAPLMRYTRAGMLEALNGDYMTTAKAKGLPSRVVLVRHGLRNALLPLITVVGLLVPELIVGAVITEQIFSWPGMGLLTVRAAQQRDPSLLMGIVLVVAVAVLTVNILVDVAYTFVDPRVRFSRRD